MYQTEEIKTIATKMNRLFDSPIALVAEKSKLSKPTVSKFFNGKSIRPSSTELPYDICLEFIEEKENKRIINLKKEERLGQSLKGTKSTTIDL